jgi:hypothetical protein
MIVFETRKRERRNQASLEFDCGHKYVAIYRHAADDNMANKKKLTEFAVPAYTLPNLSEQESVYFRQDACRNI